MGPGPGDEDALDGEAVFEPFVLGVELRVVADGKPHVADLALAQGVIVRGADEEGFLPVGDPLRLAEAGPVHDILREVPPHLDGPAVAAVLQATFQRGRLLAARSSAAFAISQKVKALSELPKSRHRTHIAAAIPIEAARESPLLTITPHAHRESPSFAILDR